MWFIINGMKIGITAAIPAILYAYTDHYSTGLVSDHGFVYLLTLLSAALFWAVPQTKKLGLHRFTALHSLLPLAAYLGPGFAGAIIASLYFAGQLLLLFRGHKEETFAANLGRQG